MLSFFRRRQDLTTHLRKTKRVTVDGIDFEIRKINVQDHLAGLNVIMQMHELYKREKPTDLNKRMEDETKLRKFMRDFLYAGIARPKLTMKDQPEEGEVHIDELTKDVELSQKLCLKILDHAYGKKN